VAKSNSNKTKQLDELVQGIINEAEFILEDRSIPKNMQQIISSISARIKENLTTLEISNILYELEDITNNTNVPDFCRSTIWSLITKLEMLKENLK